MASAVDDGEHGRYGYGVWDEEVDGHTWFGHTGGMVGYTATTIVVEDEGLGCVLLQNGGGGRQLVVAAALAAVRGRLVGRAAARAVGATRRHHDPGSGPLRR